MDRLGARRERRLHDRVAPEVALRRRGRAEPDRRVGGADVGGVAVRVAVDGDRLHAELVGGADDPKRDLAAVRDEDPSERRRPAAGVSLRKDRRHSGMFPCFFRGFVSRLSFSISSAAMRRGRVSEGTITSSM